MNKFFKVSIGLVVIVSIAFIALLKINPLSVYKKHPDHFYGQRSEQELKKIDDNFNTFKATGSCVGCDFGDRADTDEKKDFRQAIELVRGKGLSIDLSQAFLIYVNLAGSNLSGANFSGADLSNSDLIGANLMNANLSGADLSYTDLTGADLTGANLVGARLYGAILQKTNLTGAYLHQADLSMSKFDGANLTKADLTSASFMRVSLDGAILTDADLRGALINRTDLTHTVDLANAKLDGVFMRSLRSFSWWLNFVCSTITPGFKSIARDIKLNFVYCKYWFFQKISGNAPVTRNEFFTMM
jgi:uncharacterized protein YjbI with pentapeptide repeats